MTQGGREPRRSARRHDIESVIGLEVHLALATRTKLFCGCPADTFGAQPNEHVCPVCLGLPGTLPVANRQAVELAATFALALGCRLPDVTQFHRKHYFYPDAPKNYQISQFDRPIGEGGALTVGGRRIGITRCHLEEDAGRLLHPTYADHSLVDLNRAGAPLLELVTEPDLRSPEEARAFLERVRAIAQALGVSDAAPEQGKMRADVNVSVRYPGEGLGVKVEIKNLNSFKSVQNALALEIRRQALRLEEGLVIEQETRGWNEGGQKTYVLRSKEGSADYRYMADPDLPPLRLGAELVARLRRDMRELPDARRERYVHLGVRETEADLIAFDITQATTFDAMLAAAGAVGSGAGAGPTPHGLATFLTSEVAGALAAWEGTAPQIDPGALVALVRLVDDGAITLTNAKALLPDVLSGADPEKLVEARGLHLISDPAALERLVDDVLAAHPAIVASAREQPKAINALLGQVMRASGGQAKADAVRSLIERRLREEAPS
jgi:aspartyl-tRNA(Asn)/glutamyl-tRNA(Gln) amidotransferase subunit B